MLGLVVASVAMVPGVSTGAAPHNASPLCVVALAQLFEKMAHPRPKLRGGKDDIVSGRYAGGG